MYCEFLLNFVVKLVTIFEKKNSSKRGIIFVDPTASASNRDLRSPNSAVESSAVTRLQSLDATTTNSGGNGNNTIHYTVVATDCRRSALLLNTQPPYKTLNHQRYSESSSSGQVKTFFRTTPSPCLTRLSVLGKNRVNQISC